MEKNLRLGNHLVAFLDVLGQREQFKHLRLPKTAEEKLEVLEVLRRTAGFVMGLRKTFSEQFVTFESGVQSLKTLTTEQVRPNFVGFSDSFVTSVPLFTDGSPVVPISTVYSALSASATIMLGALATKHALRGGIDVGLAIEVAPQEIYGPALEKAYILESEDAGYPRILIGDGLWDYLNIATAEVKEGTTPEAKFIAKTIGRIFQWIAVDYDHRRILDYLGPVMSDLQHSVGEYKEKAIEPLYKFVLSERERFEKVGDQNSSPGMMHYGTT